MTILEKVVSFLRNSPAGDQRRRIGRVYRPSDPIAHIQWRSAAIHPRGVSAKGFDAAGDLVSENRGSFLHPLAAESIQVTPAKGGVLIPDQQLPLC